MSELKLSLHEWSQRPSKRKRTSERPASRGSGNDETYTDFIDTGCAVVPVKVRVRRDGSLLLYTTETKLSVIGDIHTQHRRAVYSDLRLPLDLVHIVWGYVDLLPYMPRIGRPTKVFRGIPGSGSRSRGRAFHVAFLPRWCTRWSFFPAAAIVSLLCGNADVTPFRFSWDRFQYLHTSREFRLQLNIIGNASRETWPDDASIDECVCVGVRNPFHPLPPVYGPSTCPLLESDEFTRWLDCTMNVREDSEDDIMNEID